jgi:hypothetical protein
MSCDGKPYCNPGYEFSNGTQGTQGTGILIFLSNEAFCPDEEFLINPSAKSLGGLWRSWRISEKIRLSRQIALERSSTG